MKKRLLITSIVMMLVVAVALSTATYAWFTSNATVTANTITMTAGTSDTSALGIAWATSSGTAGTPAWNAGYGTEIDAKAPATLQTNGFQPAAPTALGNSEPAFYTSYIDAQGYFTANGASTDVYRFTEDAQSNASNLIHIANLAQSGTKSVNLTATITDLTIDDLDVTPLIRIAAYVVSGSTPSYTYMGLLGASAGSSNTAVGTILGPYEDESTHEIVKTAASSLKTASTTTSVSLGNIEAQHEITVAIYVWLDGAAFDEAYSTQQASIELTFTAAAAV